MKLLEPIIPCFYRLPHFSNSSKKLAINVYSQKDIESSQTLLEKRLLNDLGWKVINLQMPEFLTLSLS
jgi:hypothetical protein